MQITFDVASLAQAEDVVKVIRTLHPGLIPDEQDPPSLNLAQIPMQELLEALQRAAPPGSKVVIVDEDADEEPAPAVVPTGKKKVAKKKAKAKKVAKKKAAAKAPEPEPEDELDEPIYDEPENSPLSPEDAHAKATEILQEVFTEGSDGAQQDVLALKDKYGARFSQLDSAEHGHNLLKDAEALRNKHVATAAFIGW